MPSPTCQVTDLCSTLKTLVPLLVAHSALVVVRMFGPIGSDLRRLWFVVIHTSSCPVESVKAQPLLLLCHLLLVVLAVGLLAAAVGRLPAFW